MKSFLICIGLDPDHSEPIIQHPLVVNPVTLEIPDGICYILYLFSMYIKTCRTDPVSECQISFSSRISGCRIKQSAQFMFQFKNPVIIKTAACLFCRCRNCIFPALCPLILFLNRMEANLPASIRFLSVHIHNQQNVPHFYYQTIFCGF